MPKPAASSEAAARWRMRVEHGQNGGSAAAISGALIPAATAPSWNFQRAWRVVLIWNRTEFKAQFSGNGCPGKWLEHTGAF
jgi:hypothetical protein